MQLCKLFSKWIILWAAHEWLPSSKYEFLYPCLSDKYLFMGAKIPERAENKQYFWRGSSGILRFFQKHLRGYKWSKWKIVACIHIVGESKEKVKVFSEDWSLLDKWKRNRFWVELSFIELRNLKRAMYLGVIQPEKRIGVKIYCQYSSMTIEGSSDPQRA